MDERSFRKLMIYFLSFEMRDRKYRNKYRYISIFGVFTNFILSHKNLRKTLKIKNIRKIIIPKLTYYLEL